MYPTIRTAAPEHDHPFVRSLLDRLAAPPSTAAEFDEWYAEFPESGRRWEWVAVDQAGRTVGYVNTTVEEAGDEAFELFILVDPAQQRRGLGSRLLHLAEEKARAEGAKYLSGNLNAENPAACSFAQRLGYTTERHTIDSRLDLAGYDVEGRFPGLLAGIAASGVQFDTLASDQSEERLRAVYELYTSVAPTFPGNDPGAPLQPWERWRDRLVASYEGQWDLVMLALAGGHVVGMTRMVETDEAETLYTPHTSVDPSYRGRGIGLGLKLYAMQVAMARGARYLTTNNDADNEAILAVNQRLGYVPTMSTLFVGKHLG